jgi:hypothetical protein
VQTGKEADPEAVGSGEPQIALNQRGTEYGRPGASQRTDSDFQASRLASRGLQRASVEF